VKFWCIFLSPLELTLAKNHDFEKWRACGAAPHPAARRLTADKARKNFSFSFRGDAQKNFQ
jgi:hypothetical protein